MDDQHPNLQQALNHAYFYLKFRPRSKKEVTNYLSKKSEKYGWSKEVIEKAVQKLEKGRLINDSEFVSWFIESRTKSKPKSEFAMRSELFKFGIDKDLIDLYFTDNIPDEENLALRALGKKWTAFKDLPRQSRFQKATAYLGRRGFSFDIIKTALAKLEKRE